MLVAGPIDEFNTLADGVARDRLLSCCASEAFAERVLAGRPYADVGGLLDAAERACANLDDDALAAALRGHPRIGERAGGVSVGAVTSRAEQAAVLDADTDVRRQVEAANRAYEQRFDRVFLVRAAGRTPDGILAEARRRLGNDDATEGREVRRELGEITRRRLAAGLRP